MLFSDSYKTVAGISEGVFRDRGSKFIGYVYPIRSESQVKGIVSSVKDLHPKARHHCWAWRLSPDRSVYPVNDDGEPSGTAGRPILNMILSNDLTDILLVVVRYFGGTLLGVPGLINAYKTAAAEALNSASIVEKTVNDHYELFFDHDQMNDVMKVIKNEHLKITGQEYDSRHRLQVEIRQSLVNAVMQKLGNIDGLKLRYIGTY